MLIHVDAPHYYAGFVTDTNTKKARVIRAAPIIKWTVGRTAAECIIYFCGKRYKVIVDDNERSVEND